MAQRLETLDPGTPVWAGQQRVGEVRGVYAEGESRVPEYIEVYWDQRETCVLLPTNNVGGIEQRGVVLEQSDPASYRDLVHFDPAKFPTVRKIR